MLTMPFLGSWTTNIFSPSIVKLQIRFQNIKVYVIPTILKLKQSVRSWIVNIKIVSQNKDTFGDLKRRFPIDSEWETEVTVAYQGGFE